MHLHASVSNSTGTHSSMVLAENFGCIKKNPSQRRRHDYIISYRGILRARTESQSWMRAASFATISVLYWHLRANWIPMSIAWKTDVTLGGRKMMTICGSSFLMMWPGQLSNKRATLREVVFLTKGTKTSSNHR